ncbi:MAG: hypothetical protein C7B43_04620 [Sulfobacillus benefaciens]|uniref:Uncharacterized protein n=1 Tax=Sulfobacillus benefaciens TaxID=453960 RepID=A0A2T2X8I2_9FIRM|nr:MAG: hypothetical protein C7B43_04620 [Sulfobacillus benefaciens]
MRNFYSLKILDRFQNAFEARGYDYTVLRNILQVHLTMDSRRVPAILTRSRKQLKRDSSNPHANTFISSLWFYVLLGAVVIPVVAMTHHLIFFMSSAMAILMFLVMLSMISDFSSVLLDIRDRTILASKPISPKTISMARTLRIGIYLALITLAVALPALLTALIRHGLVFFMVLAVALILMDLFIMALTALLYFLILRYFDGERLKDFINYVQIGLSLMMTIGYQLLGRSFQLLNAHIVFHPAWWEIIIPPLWFGSAFQVLFASSNNPEVMVLAAMALAVPLMVYRLYLHFMPAFERHLEKLSATAKQSGNLSQAWSKWYSTLFCRNPRERQAFIFGAAMMTREREFKLKVYPALTLSIFLPLIMMLNASPKPFQGLSASPWYLSIYFIDMMIPSAVMMMRYSQYYKAAWIYQTTPLSSPALLFRGILKALLARLVLPVYVIESVIFIAIFGPGIGMNLIVAYASTWLFAVITVLITLKDLPFSAPYQAAQQKQTYVIFLFMALTAVFAGIQYAVSQMPLGLYWYLAILLVVTLGVWRKVFPITRNELA